MTIGGERSALARELSSQIALVFRNYTGRGPMRTRVFIETDVIVCVLRGCLTRGEQRLVEAGQGDAVLRTRRAYQEAMSPELIAMIERLTGRRVTACLSDHHVRADIAVEAFVLDVVPESRTSVSDPLDREATRDG